MHLRLNLINEHGEPYLTNAVLTQIAHDIQHVSQTVPFITLEGSTVCFCSGLNLSVFEKQVSELEIQKLVEQYARVVESIQMANQPVIALVHGPATGGGVGIAAACDTILASPQATFRLPETLFGLIPAQVFPLLSSRIGVPRARQLALTGRAVNASEALHWGLIDEVTEDIPGTLARYAKQLARMERRAVSSMKKLIYTYCGVSDEYRKNAISEFMALQRSPVTRQRVTQFLAGETPWGNDEVD